MIKRICFPLLWPLSMIFTLIVRIRNYLFDKKVFKSYRSKLFVISIGNLSLGGNGKTPATMLIADILRSQGRSPIILSRGYKGKEFGPTIVIKEDSAKMVGDEPLLMAEKGYTVVVAKDRVAGAKFIEQRGLGDSIILDDGFQHRWLSRQLDFICVDCASEDAIEEFLQGETLPLGRFRESLSSSLERIDAFILSTGVFTKELSQSQTKKVSHNKPCFIMQLQPEGIFHVLTGQKLNLSKSTQEIVAFCGLAKPQNFFQTLKSLNLVLKKEHVFSDHHSFSETEIDSISNTYKLPLVCSEKDRIKLYSLKEASLRNVFFLKVIYRFINRTILHDFVKTKTNSH